MIVVHFDVLAMPSESLITRQPSPEGRRLWSTFWDRYQGRIVLVADTNTPSDLLQEWLKKENYKPSMIQVADDYHRADSTEKADAVWRVQSTMGRIDWYLDTDPDTCSRTLAMGIPTLLVAVPLIPRPEWRESSFDIKSWDVVVTELETQAVKKSERSWGDL